MTMSDTAPTDALRGLEGSGVGRLEADALFRAHPRWRGADLAYSIPLPGGDTTIWLLADGFVAPEGGTRADAVFVNNTVGVMHGLDPRTATLEMHWRERDGRPIAYFEDHEPPQWIWPGHGACLDGSLLVFLCRVAGTGGPGPWNFRHAGWTARWVEDAFASPADWEPVDAQLPDDGTHVSEGGSPLVVDGDHVLTFPRSPGGMVVCRWPVERAAVGDLRVREWWTASGWKVGAETEAQALCPAQPEFSIHLEPRLDTWLKVELHGMDHGVLQARTAPRPEGPWSQPVVLFTPPESGDPGRFLYAGKAHPHLTGADLWATYVVNDHDCDRMVADESIYYPRFVELTLP
jgi:hypothetical protein